MIFFFYSLSLSIYLYICLYLSLAHVRTVAGYVHAFTPHERVGSGKNENIEKVRLYKINKIIK